MLSRLELEDLSFADLKDLVKNTGQAIPQHANTEVLVTLMEEFYASRQKEIAEKVEQEDDAALFGNTAAQAEVTPEPKDEPTQEPDTATETKVEGKGKYAGFHTKREYIDHMLKPVLCIITPQAPEFSRQASSMASISVGNALISNREFAFIADGNTVTSVPRIALPRIRELKVLLKGSPNLNKTQMTSNTQGSAFGARFRIHELTDAEIKDYHAQKSQQSTGAATGIGL